jgi:alkylhydroperoxidase family enzyme
MSWITVIGLGEANGLLREEYTAALARAGKIWNIVSIMSRNPSVLRESMGMYRALMFGPSPLSRRQREMLAVVVSARNRCLY